MAIRDANGNFHSEINGRFIEKQEAAGRICGGDTTTSYYSTEKLRNTFQALMKLNRRLGH